MSSAIGESSGMQHGAPGSGEHVHGGLSTTLTSGVSTTPSNTRFSMAEHFAALILTHASTTNPSAQFAPSKSTGAAGAGPAAAFPLAANSSAKCVQAPTHSLPLPISSGAFLNNDTTVTSEHGAPAPMQLEMQEAKPSADGASKDTSTSATKDKVQLAHRHTACVECSLPPYFAFLGYSQDRIQYEIRTVSPERRDDCSRLS